MLYIKFKIQDSSKFKDFQKLFSHMVDMRQPNVSSEDIDPPNFDWDNLTDEEQIQAFDELNDFYDEDKQAEKRYYRLIPSYANKYFEKYYEKDNEKSGALGIQDTSFIFSYLERDFEVDLDNLESAGKNGLVEFSTGNYPFGGLERFLITLKAFELYPLECFDGFNVVEFKWKSAFEYDTVELPEKTNQYLRKPN